MANPVWPSTLQQAPDLGSAQYEPVAENILVTQMETGAPKRRRRFTAMPAKLTCSITCTGAQMATLDTFKSTTLQDTGVFDWVDVRTGATATYGFLEGIKYQQQDGFPDQWTATLSLIKVA